MNNCCLKQTSCVKSKNMTSRSNFSSKTNWQTWLRKPTRPIRTCNAIEKIAHRTTIYTLYIMCNICTVYRTFLIKRGLFVTRTFVSYALKSIIACWKPKLSSISDIFARSCLTNETHITEFDFVTRVKIQNSFLRCLSVLPNTVLARELQNRPTSFVGRVS